MALPITTSNDALQLSKSPEDSKESVSTQASASKRTTCLFDLPTEIIQIISEFLEPVSAICFAYSHPAIRDMVSTQSFKLLRARHHRLLGAGVASTVRIQYLCRVISSFPGYYCCLICFQLHRVTCETRPGLFCENYTRCEDYTGFRYYRGTASRLKTCISIPGYNLNIHHVQLALLRHKYGPRHGISLNQLKHTTFETIVQRPSYKILTSIEVRGVASDLYMRSQQSLLTHNHLQLRIFTHKHHHQRMHVPKILALKSASCTPFRIEALHADPTKESFTYLVTSNSSLQSVSGFSDLRAGNCPKVRVPYQGSARTSTATKMTKWEDTWYPRVQVFTNVLAICVLVVKLVRWSKKRRAKGREDSTVVNVPEETVHEGPIPWDPWEEDILAIPTAKFENAVNLHNRTRAGKNKGCTKVRFPRVNLPSGFVDRICPHLPWKDQPENEKLQHGNGLIGHAPLPDYSYWYLNIKNTQAPGNRACKESELMCCPICYTDFQIQVEPSDHRDSAASLIITVWTTLGAGESAKRKWDSSKRIWDKNDQWWPLAGSYSDRYFPIHVRRYEPEKADSVRGSIKASFEKQRGVSLEAFTLENSLLLRMLEELKDAGKLPSPKYPKLDPRFYRSNPVYANLRREIYHIHGSGGGGGVQLPLWRV